MGVNTSSSAYVSFWYALGMVRPEVLGKNVEVVLRNSKISSAGITRQSPFNVSHQLPHQSKNKYTVYIQIRNKQPTDSDAQLPVTWAHTATILPYSLSMKHVSLTACLPERGRLLDSGRSTVHLAITEQSDGSWMQLWIQSVLPEWVSECVGFNVPFIGHFGDESFQAIVCTGTHNQTITKRKYTERKITNPNTDKLALVKNTNTHKSLIGKPFICKNCSYQCAYDCAQLCYTIQHRTVLIIFAFILHSSHVV